MKLVHEQDDDIPCFKDAILLAQYKYTVNMMAIWLCKKPAKHWNIDEEVAEFSNYDTVVAYSCCFVDHVLIIGI